MVQSILMFLLMEQTMEKAFLQNLAMSCSLN